MNHQHLQNHKIFVRYIFLNRTQLPGLPLLSRFTTKSSSVPKAFFISAFKARPEVVGVTSTFFRPTLERTANVTLDDIESDEDFDDVVEVLDANGISRF